ncbi:MAG: chorismate synthase [Clostridia bacterium]|nr:chorismate synthase [Clostridia bacterium]
MKNTFGNHLSITLFGESHGPAIGAVLDGLAPGLPVREEEIRRFLSLRRPSGTIGTPRVEPDPFQILSGVFENKTTGTPLCLMIPNTNTRSGDYSRTAARPGHADYTAFCKYHGFEDYRGGGHFSGRITAALVAAGAIVADALSQKGIQIGTHIYKCGAIKERHFENVKDDILSLENQNFPLLQPELMESMVVQIEAAKANQDSIGGIIETAVTGMPAGIGEPWFDTVESLLSHALFSIPAVKGVEFGEGFGFADLTGSQANDSFVINEGAVTTLTNHNGGINGGITNGMPLIFRSVIKPTPSIGKEQNTVDMVTGENTVLAIRGRHDPAIFHRACIVVNAMTAITLYDMLIGRFGTDWPIGE